ncbi:YlzJ-like family protein [Halalkalibacillus halophilus]|uniref:YlzJ-like family protein n=1 Tax=Halalkalibacillus halophilus TaxID=392827 RepID=UPI000410EF39|nr:YlzJ-like family protein [Halalkalibacillus halophilus]
MILYTPLSEEEIFEEEITESSWVQVDQASVKLYKDQSANAFVIEQIASTNPNDYLKNHLQPGTIYYM